MKVFIADKLSTTCMDALDRAGHEVVNRPDAKGDALRDAIADANPSVLVVRSTRVPASLMAVAPALELVVRAGAGYDTIDVAGASSRGIFVANCPGKNAVAVAELTLGLILALDRRLPDNVIDARAGRWNKDLYAGAEGIKGRTLGLVGLGNVGREVAVRARAFGLRVIAWSRSLSADHAHELGIGFRESPLDVARDADIVSLHVAATGETRSLADATFFSAMRDGSLFINTTRASVVDEAALLDALDRKGIRAGLDVFSEEPAGKDGSFESVLAAHPSVYVSHHIGASTEQAQEAIAAEAVRIVNVYAETGEVPNCVNIAERSTATHQLTVRHHDRVGVLAAVFAEMKAAGWNVQEVENLVFAGAPAACAYIRFAGDPDPATIERISRHEDVLAVTLIHL